MIRNRPKTIERLRIFRAQIKRVLVAPFRLIEPASAHLCVAELDPAVRGVWLKGGIAGEMLQSAGDVVLLERKRTEIVTGGAEIDVEAQRFL
jgi:hypothetical protein